jgi:hypothetical protein
MCILYQFTSKTGLTTLELIPKKVSIKFPEANHGRLRLYGNPPARPDMAEEGISALEHSETAGGKSHEFPVIMP